MMTLNDLLPPALSAPATAADDPRLGHWLTRLRTPSNQTRIAILGFPSDEGVRRNGGRPGAAGGPQAIREALYKLTPDGTGGFETVLAQTVDLGDVPVTGDLETDQDHLGDVVSELLQDGITPIILGGGHETAYGHFLGYVKAQRAVSILNWDAHADVRPLKDGRAHSGSPFYQALTHPDGWCEHYTVAGLFPWRVAAAHRVFLEKHGGTALDLWELDPGRIDQLAQAVRGQTMATFDLDLIDAAQAPGVSAPGVGGLDARLWLRAAEACGRNAAFRSFDIVELNPRFDVDARTAALAALTVWHILRGLATR